MKQILKIEDIIIKMKRNQFGSTEAEEIRDA